MHLTRYADYALRVLIYLLRNPGRRVTVKELAEYYGISRNHLIKIVHDLGLKGYIQTTRGQHGGIQLRGDPAQITVGQVLRQMEPGFEIVECFGEERLDCAALPDCRLKKALHRATAAFMAVLERYTLADLRAEKIQFAGDTLAFPRHPIIEDRPHCDTADCRGATCCKTPNADLPAELGEASPRDTTSIQAKSLDL
ncbi:Rrf2 family transcriptional regulator [Methylocaldum sp.]|uniref:Rrf2 family transcriptional regulator n=1 Tax=Methylocaldum sp. TaxID=1969727 RepID=UPI002D3361D5|nr:Rrf2 family transcriptional regulator [Methylocaldum sp.]HYE36298.1 Rrf2 family transcriptional regulator [Methylocaldum sp.]